MTTITTHIEDHQRVDTERSDEARESIGTCEWCGLVDHHLVQGECPKCRQKVNNQKGDQLCKP